jgi:hypothetical protein
MNRQLAIFACVLCFAGRASADYTDWALLNFGSSAPIETSGENADPDYDGMSNILEYAFGRNPLAPDHTPPSYSFREGRLTLSMFRPKDRLDLLYYCQFADSLSGSWLAAGAVNWLPPVDHGTFEEIFAQDASGALSGKKFGRFGVVVRDIDGNGNGVFDAWEIATFGTFGMPGAGDSDGDGIPDREDAAPFNPAVGRLSITISTPVNGSTNP